MLVATSPAAPSGRVRRWRHRRFATFGSCALGTKYLRVPGPPVGFDIPQGAGSFTPGRYAPLCKSAFRPQTGNWSGDSFCRPRRLLSKRPVSGLRPFRYRKPAFEDTCPTSLTGPTGPTTLRIAPNVRRRRDRREFNYFEFFDFFDKSCPFRLAKDFLRPYINP